MGSAIERPGVPAADERLGRNERAASRVRAGRIPLVWLIVSVLGTGCSPFLVFPGGELRGTLDSSAIDDWSPTDEVEFVQIETRPNGPYSVQVYGVGSGDAFYIASQGWRGALGSTHRARWVEHLAEDPRIRLRVGETLYALKAVRVEDDAEVERVRELFVSKYGDAAESWGFWRKQPRAQRASDAFVYRLDPR